MPLMAVDEGAASLSTCTRNATSSILWPAEPDGVRERHHATVRPADLGADPAGVCHEVEFARATAQRDPPAGPCYSRVEGVSVSARSTGANDAE
jgi:hypothetical protein